LLEQPLTVAGPGGSVEVTYALLIAIVISALYSPVVWPQLGQLLEQLYQFAFGRSEGPASPRLAPAAMAPPPPPPYDNGEEAFAAISCADTDNPRNPFARPPTAQAADQRAPYFGSAFDPATRYEGAVAVSQELPRGRLLTLDGYGHTSFGKSTCVEQAETRYLVSLQLPPRGAVSKPDQQPFGLMAPTQASAQQALSIAARPPLPGVPPLLQFA
jgi:hypothetical protein